MIQFNNVKAICLVAFCLMTSGALVKAQVDRNQKPPNKTIKLMSASLGKVKKFLELVQPPFPGNLFHK